MSLHHLHPTQAVEDELEWFFNQAESDMGAQSNFRASLGIDGWPPVDPEDAAEACRRFRRIRSWLKAIPDSDAGVLQTAYELHPWPVALYDKLGRLTGVVVRLACALDRWPEDRSAQRLLETVRAGWLLAQSLTPANATLARLRHEATVRLSRATTAYARVRTPPRAPW